VIEEKRRRPQRKRIPFVYSAGSPLPPRSLDALPGEMPPTSEQPVQPLPLSVDTKKLLESWRQTASERVLTLDDVAPVALPKCKHGVRLTKDEYIFERSYKNKYHLRMNGKSVPAELRGSYFMPKSFECIQCLPVCIHGLELTAKELNSGKRFSHKCIECVGKFTNAAHLATYLAKQKLSMDRGKALTEGEVVTSYGLPMIKAGQYFAQGGGSKEIEDIDANYIEVVDDGNGVVAIQTSPSRNGSGPDTDDYDHEKVDKFDPTSLDVPAANETQDANAEGIERAEFITEEEV